jgi:hypothetical protein
MSYLWQHEAERGWFRGDLGEIVFIHFVDVRFEVLLGEWETRGTHVRQGLDKSNANSKISLGTTRRIG